MQREDTCSSHVPLALWTQAAQSQRDYLMHAEQLVGRLLRTVAHRAPLLYFVGDSVQWSSLRAFRCWLEAGGCLRADTTDPDYAKRYDIVREEWNCSTGALLVDFSYRGRWLEAIEAVEEHTRTDMEESTIIFGVSGAHYHVEWKELYERDMAEFARWLPRWVRNGTRPRHAIVRDPSPQHFPYSADGTFHGSKTINKESNATQCCARADRNPDWRSIAFDRTLAAVLGRSRYVRILKSYVQADALWFGHPAESALLHRLIGRAGAVDCTHFCYSANHLLNAGLVETLLSR